MLFSCPGEGRENDGKEIGGPLQRLHPMGFIRIVVGRITLVQKILPAVEKKPDAPFHDVVEFLTGVSVQFRPGSVRIRGDGDQKRLCPAVGEVIGQAQVFVGVPPVDAYPLIIPCNGKGMKVGPFAGQEGRQLHIKVAGDGMEGPHGDIALSALIGEVLFPADAARIGRCIGFFPGNTTQFPDSLSNLFYMFIH